MDGAEGRAKDVRLKRRDLLWGAMAFPLGHAAWSARGAALDHGEDGPMAAGLISRQRSPENLEFPFSSLNTGRFLTPNAQFFVRSHFEVPDLDTSTWRLRVEGEVEHPFEIGYNELQQLPTKTFTALLECSGNGRGFLEPPQVGIRWELGAVSTAEWTGVPLSVVLERARVKDAAIEVILEGADQGEFKPPQHPTPGRIHYARSLPLSKAKAPEVLLAYMMNGEELPPRHGYPLRAVVAGWYGMASVKWLKRIIVTDRPFHGYFQTMEYAVWEQRHGLPTLTPVSEIQVKSQIARPAPFEVVPKGKPYRMIGAAWTGESDLAKVEVSDDGGKTWTTAKLIGEPVKYAWRLWEHQWQTPERIGPHVIMARATDAQGRVQPMKRENERRDAVISHVLPIEVEVR